MGKEKVLSLSDFNKNVGPYNIKTALDRLGIGEEETAKTAAVRIVFNTIMWSQPKASSVLERRQYALGQTVEIVKARLETFRDYAGFLSRNGAYPIDQDALNFAVICHHRIETVPAILNGEDAREVLQIEPETAVRALNIARGAEAFMQRYGLKDGQFVLSAGLPESVFLAHLNMLTFLNRVDQNFDNLQDTDMEDLIIDELDPIPRWILPDTAIGGMIAALAENLENRAVEFLDKSPMAIRNIRHHRETPSLKVLVNPDLTI